MTVENQPVEKKDVQTAVISSCAATTCRYNTNQQCTAGTVMLVMKNELPACGTFARVANLRALFRLHYR